MESHRPDAGYTLIELAVVVAVLALLVALAIPGMLASRRLARDAQAALALTNGAKAEVYLAASLGSFTADPARLEAWVPELDFSGVTSGSIHAIVGDVEAGDDGQVLLYTRSVSGTWFGLRLVGWGPEVGRHTCRGELEDMTLTDCVGVDW